MDVLTASPAIDTSPLSVADRCDVCGAQAYVRASLPTGSLIFCGHHANAHRPALVAAGAALHDETDRLSATTQAAA